jgi:hypothetical protein
MMPALSPEGQKTLDTIMSWVTPITREKWRQKVLRAVKYVMAEKNVKEGGKEAVVEASLFVLRPSMRPYFARLADNPPPVGQAKAPYLSLEGYYAAQRHVKRWDPVLTKPSKPPQQMRVLGFNASGRVGGNTDTLVDEALRGAKDAGAVTEKVHLPALNIGCCANTLIQRDYFAAAKLVPELAVDFCKYSRDCKSPEQKGCCTLEDDFPALYQKIRASDALIVGFPIINSYESEYLTNFQERWARYEECVAVKPADLRRSMVVATWGTNDFETYEHIVENIALKLNMRNFTTVEAVVATGTVGLLSGLDVNGRGVIGRYPAEVEYAYKAGKTLITGIL